MRGVRQRRPSAKVKLQRDGRLCLRVAAERVFSFVAAERPAELREDIVFS